MTTATAKTARRAVAAHRWAGFPARLCAAVALASVGAHLWMGWEHRAMPWESALMVLMAAACLPCAVSVWRRGHDRGVRLLFGMSLLMVAVHAVLLLAPGSLAGHGGMAMGSMATGPTASMGAGGPMSGSVPQSASMLGIIALELAVAMAAAWIMRRSRGCPAHTSGQG
ncbi:hypothetical protein [Arthrobacter sp. STN4]|uniref:hypothetical protein n=1 Tax=Arthrobacter sp. STN4 TaxID=2923276 RepID=UPI00211A57B2|nr:hypothetical protein [Arthrobacter sp. STN4]MCQ9162838.1 hypothetical protein [Arthrobacter sp. STN4]